MPLPLYNGANHVLDQNSLEITRFIQETRDGMAVGGWELAVPEPGPDGNPFLFIFVGPTSEHRGSALRLHMAAKGGAAVPDDAQVLIESLYKSGSERQAIYSWRVRGFQRHRRPDGPGRVALGAAAGGVGRGLPGARRGGGAGGRAGAGPYGVGVRVSH